MWEILDDVDTGTQVARLKRKIEIHWADVLSLRELFIHMMKPEPSKSSWANVQRSSWRLIHRQENTLNGNRWIKISPQISLLLNAGDKHFMFSPGVLQKNLRKLVSSDSFWSKLVKVTFPTLPQSLYFDIPYGNRNNNDSNNKSRYGRCQTLNNDLFHHHPQGQVGEVNSNVATQFCANNGRQMNSFVQDNRQNKTMNQLPETHVIQPSSQLINRGRYFSSSQLNNSMIQDTGELRGSQALLETQTNSMMFEHANEISMYQVGPNLQGYLAQEGETQNMEHTHLDGNFQTNNNGSMPPDL